MWWHQGPTYLRKIYKLLHRVKHSVQADTSDTLKRLIQAKALQLIFELEPPSPVEQPLALDWTAATELDPDTPPDPSAPPRPAFSPAHRAQGEKRIRTFSTDSTEGVYDAAGLHAFLVEGIASPVVNQILSTAVAPVEGVATAVGQSGTGVDANDAVVMDNEDVDDVAVEVARVASTQWESRRSSVQLRDARYRADSQVECAAASSLLRGSAQPLTVVRVCLGITVRLASLRTLKKDVWLDDNIISTYLALLGERDEYISAVSVGTDTPRTPSYFFDALFLPTLLHLSASDWRGHYDFAAAHQQTWRVDNLFSRKRMYIPVNLTNTHWCMLVVSLHTRPRTVQWFDSYNRPGTKYVQAIKHWLGDEALAR
ncbi:hypothetical protein B484DRAFT_460796, partial [Ochromonadaceae sp. CCMP2298]